MTNVSKMMIVNALNFGKTRRWGKTARPTYSLRHREPSFDRYVSLNRQTEPHRELHRDSSRIVLSYIVLSLTCDSYLKDVDEGMLRRYATVATKPPSRLRARGKSPVALDHVSFVQIMKVDFI